VKLAQKTTREITGLQSKRIAIVKTLQRLMRLKSQKKVRKLRGKLRWEGDLDTMREGRFQDVNRRFISRQD